MALAPATAHAANTFVDQATGVDTNNCLTPATACQTIVAGLGKAGAGETAFVVDPAVATTYVENVALNGGRSLMALSSDPTETIIDNGTGGGTFPAIFIPPLPTGAPGGTVQGFTIRSDEQSLLAQAPITVRENVFDEETPPTNVLVVDVQIDASADGSLVTENAFEDPTPTAGQNQLGLFVGGSSTISNNDFDDFVSSIAVGGSTSSAPMISGNEIRGARVGSSAGVGISVVLGNPTIVGNRIDNFVFAMPSDVVTGIAISGANVVGATLQRNVVIGPRFGITIQNTAPMAPITLEGDLIVQSRINGLRLNDAAPDDVGVADATVTNVTIFDTQDPAMSGLEDAIRNDNANLALDSSIIDNTEILDAGTATCDIDFSRGPTTGVGCDDFDTVAPPMFIDYRLSAASTALIDTGNPAPPLATIDIDGQPRAVQNQPGCTLIAGPRDMGADEFQPATGVGCPLTPTLTPTPTVTPTPKKKCKKGRKLKKGKCVKKKRKKR